VNLYWPRHPFRSDAAWRRRKLRRWDEAERKAQEALLVSHGGCLDGVASAIVTLRTLGRDKVGVAFVQPTEMAEVLAHYASVPARGRRLLVADLSLQSDQFDAIVAATRRLKEGGWRIEWRDHHHKQWEGVPVERLRANLDVLTVNADATESGATLQQQALAPDDPALRRLAETVRDRDLWWNKTPDSETLEFGLSELGPRAFLRLYLDAPADFPAVLPEVASAAERDRQRQAKGKGRLLAAVRTWEAPGGRVGVVYGWLPKNTGLHDLIEQGCAIAINVRPNGKVSLRSRKDVQVCHTVAQKWHGGGHPNASGCDLRLSGLSYWLYVLRRGKVPAVERLARDAVAALA
jgi:hypothetical protein